ncbi:MAG: hypothetical protein J6V37_01720, partial [Clostridia bacterium]|nr:hypothetical protein [Clostridia bacterium]
VGGNTDSDPTTLGQIKFADGQGFGSNTQNFYFTALRSGSYTVTIEDHVGNTGSYTHTVNAGSLKLVDPLNSSNTKTITGAINNVNATYTVPQADADVLFASAYGVGNVSGWSVASGSATITSNSTYATFTVTELKDVTLNIVWQGYEFGKDENNTGVWGSEGNPYLIQTDQHLKNLARIVSGDLSPLNSVVGRGLNPTAEQVVATSVNYSGTFFKLVSNGLNATVPIGKDGNPFAGTFDGNGNTINLSISGQSYAGLFGYTSGVVKGINVTGSVSGVDFVGGIAGYNSGTVTNCINNATITASGGAVGGVVGENYGTVEHCVNMSSSIAGNTNVGSVVGRFRDGAIQYVFDFGAGRKAVGGNLTADSVKGWTFISYTAELSVPTDGSVTEGIYFVVPEALYSKIKPMDGETCKTTLGWDAILTNNFDGFCLTDVTVPNGQYLSLNMGGSIATPTGGMVADYTSNYAGALEIEQIEYNKDNTLNNNVVVTFEDITESKSVDLNPAYDGTHKADFHLVSTNWPAGYTASAWDGTGDYSAPRLVAGSDFYNVGSIELVAEIRTNVGGVNYVLGIEDYKITIAQRDLSSDSVKVFYVGDVYGLDAKSLIVNGQTISNAYDVTNGGIIRYADNISGTYYVAVIPAGQSTYTALYSIAYGATTGTSHPSTLNGAVTATHNSTYNNSTKFGYDSTSEFTGTGNYTGSRTITYTILGSDFGKNTGATGAWGSSTNPYVISHWSHLVRLSEIVNKVNDPIDSVAGKGTQPTNVQASNIFFTGGCYFEVQGTIELPDGIDFKPIGGSEVSGVVGAYNNTHSYFGGNIYGTNGDAAAEINLGNSLSEYNKDYSGLFGIVMG